MTAVMSCVLNGKILFVYFTYTVLHLSEFTLYQWRFNQHFFYYYFFSGKLQRDSKGSTDNI